MRSQNALLVLAISMVIALTDAQQCTRKEAEVVIAVDSSKSIDKLKFRQMKCQASRFVNQMKSIPNIAVTAISFANNVKKEEDTTSNSFEYLVKEIRNFQHFDSETPRLDSMLNSMDSKLKKKSDNNVVKFFAYFISGEHNDESGIDSNVRDRARRLRYNDKVIMFGVTPVKQVRGRADYLNALTGYSFRQLRLEHNPLLFGFIERNVLQDCYSCYKPTMDIIFLVDNSGSMLLKIQHAKNYMKKFVNGYNIGGGQGEVRIAAIVYGEDYDPTLSFELTDHTTKSALNTAISGIQTTSHGARSLTEKAIAHLETVSFRHVRDYERTMVIHLTDEDTMGQAAKDAWEKLKNGNVQVFEMRFNRDQAIPYSAMANRGFPGGQSDPIHFFCINGQFPLPKYERRTY